jgi:hypothetical protein
MSDLHVHIAQHARGARDPPERFRHVLNDGRVEHRVEQLNERTKPARSHAEVVQRLDRVFLLREVHVFDELPEPSMHDLAEMGRQPQVAGWFLFSVRRRVHRGERRLCACWRRARNQGTDDFPGRDGAVAANASQKAISSEPLGDGAQVDGHVRSVPVRRERRKLELEIGRLEQLRLFEQVGLG